MTLKPRTLLLALVLPAFASPQEADDNVFIDEVKKEVLDRIDRLKAAGDWRGLFEAYANAMSKHQGKLVRSDPASTVWIGVVEHLHRQFSRLPAPALEYYRNENDGRAQAAYSRAMQEGDLRALQEVVDQHFFSSVADQALDRLGNIAFEERRNDQAIFHWRRLLEHYPDSEIPREVTAAKVGMAAAAAGKVSALDQVRRHAEAEGIDGDLLEGTRTVRLRDFLASLRIDAAPPTSAPALLPTIPEGEGRFRRRIAGIRNDIKRWTADFADPGTTPSTSGGRVRIFRGGQPPAPLAPEHPFLPAYGKVGGVEMVLFTDGRQVTAVDPRKVGNGPGSGVLWRFPREPVKRSGTQASWEGFSLGSPLIGATIDGNLAYVPLYSEKHASAAGGNPRGDLFEGPARLVCIDLARRDRVLWDTDGERLHAALRKLDFYDRNWAVSTPPLVRGDSLYVGLCSSPMGESESRVLCLDRWTGEVRWHAFLASVAGAGQNIFWGGMVRRATYLTFLAEEGGVLYAHTNLGAVAALNPVTGGIQWLSRYPRTPSTGGRMGHDPSQSWIRPASAPVIHRGRLYLLPQDQAAWQIISLADGRKIQPPATTTRMQDVDVEWPQMTQLLGVIDDWLIVAGSPKGYLINLVDRLNDKGEVRMAAGWSYNLDSDSAGCGRGVVDGELFYLPTGGADGGTLHVYTGGTFKRIWVGKWKDPGDFGNLMIAGDRLVVTTASRAMIYTDIETLRSEFLPRLAQNPPSPAAYLEHGDLMRQNARLDEAAASYLVFIDAAAGQPPLDGKVREIRADLHAIFLKRGIDAAAAAKPELREPAAEFFRRSRDFSWDDDTFAESTRRLAEAIERSAADRPEPAERIRLARAAVEEYQRIVARCRDSYHRAEGGDVIQKAWVHAAARIREIGKTHGAAALEAVEKAASEALARIDGADPARLRALIDLYPHTAAAAEALGRAAAAQERAGDWRRAVSSLRELRERHPDRWTPALHRRLLASLEALEDWGRAAEELRLLASQFEGVQVPDSGGLTGKAFAERERPRILAKSRRAAPTLPAAMRRIIALPEPAPGRTRFELVPTIHPVPVTGEAPAAFGPELELVAVGSSVELWDFAKGERRWAVRHPGRFLGAIFSRPEAGGGVGVLEIREGSPADRAGLRNGDVILSVDGRDVDVETFDLVISSAASPSIRLKWRRDAAPMEARVDLEDWPVDARPPVVGAVFTAAQSVAIAWEDAVASCDLASGRVEWVFRSLRSRFVIHRAGGVDGRILLHEALRPGALRSPFRLLSQAEVPPPAADAAHGRVIALDDVTGDVAWAKPVSMDAESGAVQKVDFLPSYFGGTVALIVETFRGGNKVTEPLLLRSSDGGEASKLPSFPNVMAWAVDEERGVLCLIDGANRTLRAFPLRPATGERGLETVVLAPRYADPNTQSIGVAAGGGYVAVAAAPWQAGGAAKVSVFSMKTGRLHATVTLPEGRTLMMNRGGLIALGADGTLYVHTLPAGKGMNPAAGARRSFLTAWRILDPAKAEDPKVELAWDAVAPALDGGGGEASILPLEEVVLFVAERATEPAGGDSGALVTVHSRADGGYLVRSFSPASTGRAAVAQRGRLFIRTGEGVEVWGR